MLWVTNIYIMRQGQGSSRLFFPDEPIGAAAVP